MAEFTFIRPYWLIALFPLALILILIIRRKLSRTKLDGLVSPHLLEHLVIKSAGNRGHEPVLLFTIIALLSVIALAGPSFSHRLSPSAEDDAALVILLEVSESMLTEDIQPTRLDRAVQKIKDLQEFRKGHKTSLIAYAGSSHTVIPITDDAGVIADFAAVLKPDIMPKKGEALTSALLDAENMLKDSGLPGSILLIHDGVTEKELNELNKVNINYAVTLYTLSANPNEPALTKLAERLKAERVRLTAGKEDVEILNKKIKTDFTFATVERIQREENGFWLVILIVLLSLFQFRRGWRISYE